MMGAALFHENDGFVKNIWRPKPTAEKCESFEISGFLQVRFKLWSFEKFPPPEMDPDIQDVTVVLYESVRTARARYFGYLFWHKQIYIKLTQFEDYGGRKLPLWEMSKTMSQI